MGHVLDQIPVLDSDGREIPLGRLWEDRAAVLVFVRHFGCLFCRQQMAELQPLREQVRARGAELVVVGHGTLEEMRAFLAEQPSVVPVFTDPARRAYCALGMRRGARSVLTPRVLARSLRARWRGFRQTRIAGDPFQQGGVVVVDRGGVERYRYISPEAGAHAPAAEIIAALDIKPTRAAG